MSDLLNPRHNGPWADWTNNAEWKAICSFPKDEQFIVGRDGKTIDMVAKYEGRTTTNQRVNTWMSNPEFREEARHIIDIQRQYDEVAQKHFSFSYKPGEGEEQLWGLAYLGGQDECYSQYIWREYGGVKFYPSLLYHTIRHLTEDWYSISLFKHQGYVAVMFSLPCARMFETFDTDFFRTGDDFHSRMTSHPWSALYTRIL